MSKSLKSLFETFEGIEEVTVEKAEIDKEDGGILPAAVSLKFTPDKIGFHALEFIVWGLGDIRKAGAEIRYYVRSPPPWLNTPGSSFSLDVYVHPRSPNLSKSKAIKETAHEIKEMTSFFAEVHTEFWPLCSPENN